MELIIAHDQAKVIGFRGSIPWKNSEDLEHFKKLTDGKVLLMGRKTYDSLPEGKLPGRTKVIFSRNIPRIELEASRDKHIIVNSIEKFLFEINLWYKLYGFTSDDVMLIGGGEVISYLSRIVKFRKIHISEIPGFHNGDTFFDLALEKDYVLVNRQELKTFNYCTYVQRDRMINFDQYQKTTSQTAIYPKSSFLTYLALGLTGESGELANKIKKIIRDKKGNVEARDVDDIISELGDVMWYIARLADELGIPLSEVAQRNNLKLADRMNRGKIKGSGDNR